MSITEWHCLAFKHLLFGLAPNSVLRVVNQVVHLNIRHVESGVRPTSQ